MNLDLEQCGQRWRGLGDAAATAPALVLRNPRTRWWLRGGAAWRALESSFALVAAAAASTLVPAHAGAPWELAVVLATVAMALVWSGASAARCVAWRRLRVDLPVVLAQRDVLRLQRAEARATLVALAVGVCWWLPTALLAIEFVGGPAWLGVVDGPWLAANLGFGLVFACGLQRLARRLARAGRAMGSRDRWLQLLGGVTLADLAAELADLAALEPAPGAGAAGSQRNTPGPAQ